MFRLSQQAKPQESNDNKDQEPNEPFLQNRGSSIPDSKDNQQWPSSIYKKPDQKLAGDIPSSQQTMEVEKEIEDDEDLDFGQDQD